jgi:hypothetical protein
MTAHDIDRHDERLTVVPPLFHLPNQTVIMTVHDIDCHDKRLTVVPPFSHLPNETVL